MTPFTPDRDKKLQDPRLGIGGRHNVGAGDWGMAPDSLLTSKPEKSPTPEVDVPATLRKLADPALRDLVNPSFEVIEHELVTRTGRRSTGNLVTRPSRKMPQHRA